MMAPANAAMVMLAMMRIIPRRVLEGITVLSDLYFSSLARCILGEIARSIRDIVNYSIHDVIASLRLLCKQMAPSLKRER